MKKLLCGAVVALVVLAVGQMNAKNAAPKPIDKIMEEAHAGGAKSLRGLVTSGKGTAEDAKKLLALYEDLGKNEPPKGDKAAWKKKTDAVLVAIKKVAAKPDDAVACKALTAATACAACHKEHKP
jgi:hypothetical protein